MRTTSVVLLLAAVSTVTGRAVPLEGQQRVVVPEPLMAIARNDLTFGTVLPGINVTVPARDIHSGLFEIAGPSGASVRVEFNLPANLVASHGAFLPVAFGAADGYASFRVGVPGVGQFFNPHGPLIGALDPHGKLFVHIGGTAMPNRPQPGGAYRAIIYLTVYDLGS
jgi:hypothetical protein